MLPRLTASACLAFLFITVCTSCRSSGTGSRVLDPEAEYFKPAVRVYFDTGTDEPNELDVFNDGSLTAAVDFLGLNFPFLVHKGPTDDSLTAELNAAERRLESARAKRSRLAAANAPDADEARFAEQDEADLVKTVERAKLKKNRANGYRLNGDWVIGPRIAFGLTSPAGDSESGTAASGAPVVYVSAGLFADFNKSGSLFEEDGVGVRLEIGWLLGVSSDETLADADDTGIYVGLSAFL